MHPSRRRPDESQFVIDVHDLGRRPGDTRQLSLDFEAPAELGIGMIGVPQDSEITVELTLHSVVEGILVTGTVAALLKGDCSRCLESLEYSDIFDIQELYFWPEKRDEADEDSLFVEAETIDLEDVIRDAVVLTLPFAPTCRDDCAGLCPDCGANLNADPAHSHGEQVDSRWEKLLDLFPDSD